MEGYKPKKASKGPAKKPGSFKLEKVYVSTGSSRYRFSDGTTVLLEEGVSPRVTEAQMKELIKFKRVREVK